jgi:hypothetical protein
MPQNRNKLMALFIGNISNAMVHEILKEAIKTSKEELAGKYRKEFLTSFEIAQGYRQKINPVNNPFPEKDLFYIKSKIIRNVKAELSTRIKNGYTNINLDLIEPQVNNLLKDLKVMR